MGKIVVIIQGGLVRQVLAKDVNVDVKVEVIDKDTDDPDEQDYNDEQMKLIDESYKNIY